MTNVDRFQKFGCVRLDNFIDPAITAIISQYFENRILRGEWVQHVTDADPTTKFFYYADPLIEVILKNSKAVIEGATGKELLPTYSYAQIYQPTEELAPHIDRPQCEYSVTINVASKGDISPIYTQYNGVTEQHVLNPGDAVVYKGCEVRHWRKPLEHDQLNVQFMLHYVDKNGPYAGYYFDGRTSLSAPLTKRR
jgi:hypothetical protein